MTESPSNRRKKKKRIFSKGVKLPYQNSLSTSQHTHIFTTQDGNEKRLSLPIETIIEDVMEDPEHFLDELNDSNVKDEEERSKILAAIKEININQKIKENKGNAYVSISGKDLTVRRNVEDADSPGLRKKKNWRDKLLKGKSTSVPSEVDNKQIQQQKEQDEHSRISEILKGFMSYQKPILEEEDGKLEDSSEDNQEVPFQMSGDKPDKTQLKRKMTSVFRTEILAEGNVTKLSTEEMNYLEQKLTRSEEDQRIKNLIQRRKAREMIEKRLKDIDVRFAEGAEQTKQADYKLEGTAKVLRYQAKIIKLKTKSNLPAKLPDNIVYWNRLENRVVSQRVIKTNKFLNFYDTCFSLHKDQDAVYRACGDEYPLIKSAEIWADKERDEYTNDIEKKIHLQTKWPNALEKRECEGYIRFERARCCDVWFNSRFESGNLRQVYRVNKEDDFEEIEAEDPLPDYLPEEELALLIKQRKQRQEIVDKMLKEKHQLEDIEEEKLMKEYMARSDAKTIRRQEKLVKKQDMKDQGFDDEYIKDKLNDLFGDLASDDDEEAVELLDENQINSQEEENLTIEQIQEKAKAEAVRNELRKKFQHKQKDKKKTVGPDCEYNLYLQDDTQADSAAYQWYYFAVMNIKADTRVRINIVNLSKPNSLYAKGMQPFVYSMHLNKSKGKGWHRGGENINFFSNSNVNRFNKMTLDAEWLSDGTPNIQNDQFKKMHTLQFDYRFEANYDIVFFAHFVPYTYQDLIHYLCKLEGDAEIKKIMRIDYLCNSLGQAPVYGLTITNDLDEQYVGKYKEIFKFQRFEYTKNKVKHKKIKKDNNPKEETEEGKEAPKDQPGNEKGEKMYKKHIFITSRVHPGESQASHMVEGMINYLVSDHPEAVEIRSKFVIKIIPMLNPDGVIFGNYRSSLLGVDLNRRWKKPSKYLHPEIYYAKQIIKYFDLKSKQPECESGGVVLYCDFHGHSKNLDAFMYSCIDLADESKAHFNNMVIRATPTAIDRFIPIFNIRECKFAIEKEKENTARIVLFKEFGILSSYTFEVTFFGSEFLRHMKQQMTMYHTRETVAEINQRYGYILGRKDIQIQHHHMHYIGEDLARGINFASKKRPLVNYWFRIPPKVLVEISNPFEKEKDENVDLTLLELEKAWLPTGKVQQDRHLEIGEKFETLNRVKLERKEEEARLKEETLDDIAVKRRMEAQRKEALTKKKETEKKKKAAQQRLEIQEKKQKNKLDLQKLKGDAGQEAAIEIKSPKKAKKKKKKFNESTNREDSPERPRKMSLEGPDAYEAFSDNEVDRKRYEIKHGLASKSTNDFLTRKLSSQSLQNISKNVNLNLTKESFKNSELESPAVSISEKEKEDSKPKSPEPRESSRHVVPIAVHHNVRINVDEEEESETEQNHKLAKKISTLDISKGTSPRIQIETLSAKVEEKNAESRLSKGKTPNQQQLPPISDRVTPKLAIIQERKQKEKRLKQIAELSSQDSLTKRQSYQAMISKQSGSKDAAYADSTLKLVADDEQQLIKLVREKDIVENESKLSDRELDVPLAEIKSSSQTGGILAYDASNQYITQASISTFQKPSLLLKPETLEQKINHIFRLNRLSVDPLVVPSTKIDIVSKLKTSTMEKEKNQFQSAKKRKPVFAPANAVYTSQSLLQHPELAKKQGIHFTVGDPMTLNLKAQLAQDTLKHVAKFDTNRRNETQTIKQTSISIIMNQLPSLSKYANDSIATIGINRNEAIPSTSLDYTLKFPKGEHLLLLQEASNTMQPAFSMHQRDLMLRMQSPIHNYVQPTRSEVTQAFQSLPALSPKYTVPQKDGFKTSNYHSDRKPKRMTDAMRRDPRIVLRPLMTQDYLQVELEDQETRIKKDEIRKSPRTSPEVRHQMIRSGMVQQMISSLGILDNKLYVHKSDKKHFSDY